MNYILRHSPLSSLSCDPLCWYYLATVLNLLSSSLPAKLVYYTGINCTFTFRTTNGFGCFCCIMTQFELIKCKFLNEIALHIHLCGFVCAPTTPISLTSPRTITAWIAQSRNIRLSKGHVPKYCKTFDSPKYFEVYLKLLQFLSSFVYVTISIKLKNFEMPLKKFLNFMDIVTHTKHIKYSNNISPFYRAPSPKFYFLAGTLHITLQQQSLFRSTTLGLQLVWIQCFPSRPVAIQRLKSSVCPTINRYIKEA